LRAPSATRCPRMDTPPAPWSPGLAAICLCPSPPFFTRRQPLHLLPPLIAQPFSIRPCQLLQSSFYSTKLFLWPHPLHQMRQVMLKMNHLAHFCRETVPDDQDIPPFPNAKVRPPGYSAESVFSGSLVHPRIPGTFLTPRGQPRNSRARGGPSGPEPAAVPDL
jgi:hypothetical protein